MAVSRRFAYGGRPFDHGAIALRQKEQPIATLITGGNGFVGLNVAEYLLERGQNVVALSRRPLPPAAMAALDGLPGHLFTVQADVRDGDAVNAAMAAGNVDRVVHGAAITAAEARERSAATDIVSVNVMGTVTVFESAHRFGVKRFVQLSSSAVYGDLRIGSAPVDERTAPEPANLYGVTKLAAEQIARRLGGLWGTDVVCARIAAAFGPWERHTGVRDTISPFVDLARLALDGEPAAVAYGADLDWIYSRDVAQAVATLLDADDLHHDVYNIAPGSNWSVREFAQLLESRFAGFSHSAAASVDRADVAEHTVAGIPRLPIGIDRIREVLPGFPLFDPGTAMNDYLQWITRHPEYVRELRTDRGESVTHDPRQE